MPTLVRFFIVLLVLAGLAGAGMFYLANFVQPNTREMTVRIPSDKLEPTPITPPAEPTASTIPVAPGDAAADPAAGAATPTDPAAVPDDGTPNAPE